MDDYDQRCSVHFPPPAWLPRFLHAAWVKWRGARIDAEQGELWSRDLWGRYETVSSDLSLWLTPLAWGLGIDYEDDWRREAYVGDGGRRWASITVGPLCLSLAVCQPYIEPPRRPKSPTVPLAA
jgi:hypothetical protein